MPAYLCEEVNPAKYSSILRLRKARATPGMPTVEDAARKIIDTLPRLWELPVDRYADIRTL